MNQIEKVARALAKADGLDFDEVCGVDANPDDGYCDSGTCVAAHWEEHDAERARRWYMRLAKAAIATMPVQAEPQWQGIESAPKDCNILVWFDHEADPYQEPQEPHKLTPYAAWAEGGEYLGGKGHCIAKWHPQHFETEDEYGNGYWMPAAWFAYQNGDWEVVCNPTHWMPLPTPPAGAKP